MTDHPEIKQKYSQKLRKCLILEKCYGDFCNYEGYEGHEFALFNTNHFRYAKKNKKKFGDDFSQEEQHEEALDGDYVDPEQQKKEEEERERKEAVMNHNGDVRMELKARPTEWLQGQKKRVRVEFEEDSPSSSDDGDDEEEEEEKETEVDEDLSLIHI